MKTRKSPAAAMLFVLFAAVLFRGSSEFPVTRTFRGFNLESQE